MNVQKINVQNVFGWSRRFGHSSYKALLGFKDGKITLLLVNVGKSVILFINMPLNLCTIWYNVNSIFPWFLKSAPVSCLMCLLLAWYRGTLRHAVMHFMFIIKFSAFLSSTFNMGFIIVQPIMYPLNLLICLNCIT